MILGFKPQFKEPILAGTKLHTIRRDENNRWRAGNKIQFATGVRTKNYSKFKDGVCLATQKIAIKYETPVTIPKYAKVFVDNRCLYPEEIEMLAINDGFPSSKEFFEWFSADFEGKIIHWETVNY